MLARLEHVVHLCTVMSKKEHASLQLAAGSVDVQTSCLWNAALACAACSMCIQRKLYLDGSFRHLFTVKEAVSIFIVLGSAKA